MDYIFSELPLAQGVQLQHAILHMNGAEIVQSGESIENELQKMAEEIRQ